MEIAELSFDLKQSGGTRKLVESRQLKPFD